MIVEMLPVAKEVAEFSPAVWNDLMLVLCAAAWLAAAGSALRQCPVAGGTRPEAGARGGDEGGLLGWLVTWLMVLLRVMGSEEQLAGDGCAGWKVSS